MIAPARKSRVLAELVERGVPTGPCSAFAIESRMRLLLRNCEGVGAFDSVFAVSTRSNSATPDAPGILLPGTMDDAATNGASGSNARLVDAIGCA